MSGMRIEIIDLLFILIIALALLSWEKIGVAIQELARGGPRPPSHPLPGDDSKFLNRRRSADQRESPS
jgi:hypothetical protein